MQVIFSKNNGGSFTNLIHINRGVSSDPSCKFWFESWNSQSRFTGDASHVGYNNGCKILKGNLIIHLVAKDEADVLRAFFTDVIRHIHPFAITLTFAGGADLGKGAGVRLDQCYIDGDASTESLITPLGKGGKFTVTIPYVCLDYVTTEGAFP